MLTDKQSLYLCGFVAVGFLVAGIFNILDNFIIIALLGLAFLTIIVNIFVVNPFEEEGDTEEKKTNTW